LLTELTITNFAIIDELRLEFTPGFNVLTGETGAGKSIIVDAVSLLLGGRADTTFVRSGAEVAQVEGIFRLDNRLQIQINPVLEREGLEGDGRDTLVLGREIRASGRNYCRVNGRTVSLALLEEISQPLVDIHGQSEHLSLLRVRSHQRLLDRFGGLDEQREILTQEVRKLQAVRKELAGLLRDEQEQARRIDQLTYQAQEIDAARLQPGEEEDLTAERTRLANAEQLSQLAGEAYITVYEGRDEQPSVADLLGQVTHALTQLHKIDPSLAEQEQLAESLAIQVDELARALRDYQESIEFSPGRLAQVEERLSLIYSLKRKYGHSIHQVLAFGARARAELESITHSEERVEALHQEEERLRQSSGRMAADLSQTRGVAGQRLAVEVEAHLADLNMGGARFAVDITWSDDPDGVYVGERSLACDERGVDRVEFLIAPNVGEGLKPLVKVASGGETSRLMLALKTVLSKADETPTLIFDEIDQGIGGRIGGVVGRKLWGLTLADGLQHQVLCVTHLPQIAGYADTHFHVEKGVSGERTTTRVRILNGDDRVEELALMLGTPSQGTRRSAQEILAEAAEIRSAGKRKPSRGAKSKEKNYGATAG
jgi:DNA repair protein RecN (Recombination protein N)